ALPPSCSRSRPPQPTSAPDDPQHHAGRNDQRGARLWSGRHGDWGTHPAHDGHRDARPRPATRTKYALQYVRPEHSPLGASSCLPSPSVLASNANTNTNAHDYISEANSEFPSDGSPPSTHVTGLHTTVVHRDGNTHPLRSGHPTDRPCDVVGQAAPANAA
ncbi:hypothetical protein GGI19_007160, partial [Coemansia pectinata]